MQLTNIARDVLEDAQRGRRYIPCDTPVALVALGEHDEAVKTSIASVITLSKFYYRSGLAGLLYLPRIVRPCIYIMARTYSEIGAEILRNRVDWSGPRSVVSPLRKTWIVLSSLPYCLWLLVKKSPAASSSTHEKSLHFELNELPGTNH
jgi:phytoene synthase